MPDLGRAFLAAAARSPTTCAIVDGDRRLDYAGWLDRIYRAVAGLDALGLRPGDRLVTVLRNRLEAATLHWACQFAGVVITPVNWRATSDELGYVLGDADARALVHEPASAEAAAAAAAASSSAAATIFQAVTAGMPGRCTGSQCLRRVSKAAPSNVGRARFETERGAGTGRYIQETSQSG